MKVLYISMRDTDGIASEFEIWMIKNHPEITAILEKDGVQTVLLNEKGKIIPQNFWEDFYND